MKRLRFIACFLALATVDGGLAYAAAPVPPTATAVSSVPITAAPAVTPAPSQPAAALPALPITPLATQLGQTIQTLVGVPPAKPSPAASGDSDDAAPTVGGFAGTILNDLTQAVAALKADSATFSGTVASAVPAFADWWGRQSADPHRQALWSAIGDDIIITVGAPLLAAIAASLLLLPLRSRLRRENPEHVGGRVALLAALLALRMIPVILFTGAALLLLDQNESRNLPRYVILNLIYALALGGGLYQCLRALFAPAADHLRLPSFTAAQAGYGFRWMSAFGLLIVFGYFTVDTATALRVPPAAITVCEDLLELILTIMAMIVIFQCRLRVALILRGKKSDDGTGFGYATREWLARRWHILAAAYLTISLAVTALGIEDGVGLMLRGTLATVAILAAARMAFVALDQWAAPQAGNQALAHRQFLSFLIRPLIWIAAAMACAAMWGFRIASVIGTASGQRALNAFLSIALTLLILTVIYEILNSAIERHLSSRDRDGKAPAASARTRTLLPMVRASVFIVFSGIAVLTFLAAIGINIAPVLAGAGVVGVAIGFGSQSLVKDFLTGLFIVVENTVAVGDVVTIGAFGGVVEAMSIRTIRLRDTDGSLHILPFSEVSKITNMTRGFAYAVVDVNVAYDSDIDAVMQVLRAIGAELQEDPIFKRVILEPIEVMGIETLNESSITIRSRMRTRPGKQWDVKRLLLGKIIKRFPEEKIEMPFPTVAHIVKTAGGAP